MTAERTQVAIIGAGPAGLMLAHILHRHGIDSIVIERRDRAYVERRLRAGVLEQGDRRSAARGSASASAWTAKGSFTTGINLQFEGERHRIALSELTGGRAITVYGQHEVVKDLIAARLARGRADRLRGRRREPASTSTAIAHASASGRTARSASCAATSSPAATASMASARRCHSRWQRSRSSSGRIRSAGSGILAATPPSLDELIYAYHERGFALHSMRSPQLTRLYVQCAPDDALDELAGRARLGGAAAAPDDARRVDAARRAGRWRRASRRCAASSSSRCSTGGSSSPGMRRTSCRRPAPRG